MRSSFGAGSPGDAGGGK